MLALPAFVIALDFSVLNLAVPVISRDLMPTATELLWVVDIYGFILAGFLVTMGTLGDRIGRRRLLMIGAAGFGLASVAAAYSVSAGRLSRDRDSSTAVLHAERHPRCRQAEVLPAHQTLGERLLSRG